MPPPRSVPFAIRKYRERGYSASGPGSHLGGGGEHHTPATQDDRRGEFEVRYVSRSSSESSDGKLAHSACFISAFYSLIMAAIAIPTKLP